MGDTSGFGTVDPSDGLRDVVRLHSGSDNDTAFDFDMANDYIFIGSADRADVILTQVSPSQWVATLAGGAPGDSLTINFLSGSEPANEDDLRLRLIDDTRYTPPRMASPRNGTSPVSRQPPTSLPRRVCAKLAVCAAVTLS